EYGIDIMNVNSIAHASRFTYVPNAAPFVRGVYNLRGDIISVIDLRTMFHLPAERKGDDAMESLIILRIEDHALGVIVDGIDKVVGVSSINIQPPHPIFGDINVKYIKGIIENQGKLYIILNVEKLFAMKKAEDKEPALAAALAPALKAPLPEAPSDYGFDQGKAQTKNDDLTANFIRETLFSFRRFGSSPVNEEWFTKRYGQWTGMRKSNDLQLKEVGDADSFLETFFSPCDGQLWTDDYAQAVMAALPAVEAKTISVWNPGCGRGYETYSLVCALKKRYPDTRVKVWANDSDLLAISMAPNLVFMSEEAPAGYEDFMVKGRNGWTFNQVVRESIFFEFHDVLNANPVPPSDIIMCRDTVSFMAASEQKRLLSDFEEKAKPRAAVLLGVNEVFPLEGWKRLPGNGISVFIRA
ncbi:MAG TPA: CheR family methyltransferase, partial [Spirochaetales bacterium]|nr:CheR family methyltransferase [Spirochaetales bacterium]